MSLNNENIIDLLNYIISSDDLSLIYKKIFVKKIINKYVNDNNKDIIQNFLKINEDIYGYIYLSEEKKKIRYQKILQQKKQYYQENKEKIKEKGKQYYYKHKEEQKKEFEKIKEENTKLKEIINSIK